MTVRWVIVAQLSGDTHTPTVYGTWETEEGARAQLERWERRIERAYGDCDGFPMTVEPMYGKTTARFERDFANLAGEALPP